MSCKMVFKLVKQQRYFRFPQNYIELPGTSVVAIQNIKLSFLQTTVNFLRGFNNFCTLHCTAAQI